MIVETKVHACRKCESQHIVKNGKNVCGSQQYLCRDCGASGVLNPKVAYTEEVKDLIIDAYQERSSMRGIERTFGVSRQTLSHWLKKRASELPPLSDTLQPASTASPILELDELWSFVFCKLNKIWIWIALCRETRQVVAFAVGDRSQATCLCLWSPVPEVYKKATCYSDFWEAYQCVIPDDQHRPVSKQSEQTSHIERWNNTLRQHLGRFVRKTLSFSKLLEMHEICLELFLHRYNTELLPKLASHVSRYHLRINHYP